MHCTGSQKQMRLVVVYLYNAYLALAEGNKQLSIYSVNLPYSHREQLFHNALEEERTPSLLC